MDNDLDLSELNFEDMDKAGCYTKNTHINKTINSSDRTAILKGILQLLANINKIMRQLNAYDSSSIIIGEANWIKRNHFSKYMPSAEDVIKKIKFGHVCTIDYGKTYKGEIGYIHPGLCVGKRDNKYLVVPMTTGSSWRHECYHPVNNPDTTKENRQSCISEGFSKDGVLLIQDTKFISGGRILDVNEMIHPDALEQIQEQIYYVMFPNQYKHTQSIKEQNKKYNNIIENQKNQISNLKKKVDNLSNKIEILENKKQTE